MREWFYGAKKSMPGRAWGAHIVIWLACALLFIEIIQSTTENPSSVLFPISTLMFGLHEMAHVVTGFLPDIFTASAGSVSELLFGATLVAVAYKKRAYVSTFILSLGYMFSAMSAGRYMADTRSQLLPLTSVASAMGDDGEVVHDWHFVFGKLGILNADVFIGAIVKTSGIILAIAGLGIYAYCIYLMTQKPATLQSVEAVENNSPKPVATVAYSNDPKDFRK